jgi:hypothetical protein
MIGIGKVALVNIDGQDQIIPESEYRSKMKYIVEININKSDIFIFMTNKKDEKNILQKFKNFCKKNENKFDYFENWKTWNLSIQYPLIEKKNHLDEYVCDYMCKEGIDRVRGGSFLNKSFDQSQIRILKNLDICKYHLVKIETCGCYCSKNYFDDTITISDSNICGFCECCHPSIPFYDEKSLFDHEVDEIRKRDAMERSNKCRRCKEVGHFTEDCDFM